MKSALLSVCAMLGGMVFGIGSWRGVSGWSGGGLLAEHRRCGGKRRYRPDLHPHDGRGYPGKAAQRLEQGREMRPGLGKGRITQKRSLPNGKLLVFIVWFTVCSDRTAVAALAFSSPGCTGTGPDAP